MQKLHMEVQNVYRRLMVKWILYKTCHTNVNAVEQEIFKKYFCITLFKFKNYDKTHNLKKTIAF